MQLFQPIRSETKTNHCLRMHIACAVSQLCVITSSFDWFTGWVSILFDWPKKLLWFWFYDTRLKLALTQGFIVIYLVLQKGSTNLHVLSILLSCPFLGHG